MTKAGFLKFSATILVMLLITASLIWIYSLTEFSKTSMSNKQIDSFLKNTEAKQYSPLGRLKRVTHISFLKHFPKLDMSVFQNPNITLYANNTKPWKITALHGKAMHHNQLIVLSGNVIAKQEGSKQQSGTTIKTPKLYYHVDAQVIDNNAFVTIIRNNSITTAMGLHFNLKTNQLILKSHMVTHIASSHT